MIYYVSYTATVGGQRNDPKVKKYSHLQAAEADEGFSPRLGAMLFRPSVSVFFCPHPSFWLSVKLSGLRLSLLAPGAPDTRNPLRVLFFRVELETVL
jgi:hypothetical protein